MALSVGDRLGHYDVSALIGEGGMGQVYLATDTKLGRAVALKILPDAFAVDADRLARFQREAQVLASLNHAGIAAIYGIEEDEATGTKALVLELVEGPTLEDRIAQGAIPIEDALSITRQIAEALEAAHDAGIVHRDLKPANIKIREDGTVKVLDFGLAKPTDGRPEGDPSQSPTMTKATQIGTILGTAAYMSPEQARGKPVDRRADIWALGVVLYEMLSGGRAFAGDDISMTLSSVLQKEPDWQALPPGVPPAVAAYLRRCLHKDPKQRVQSAGDLRLAIDGAFDVAATETRTVGASRRRLFPTVLATATITALAFWFLLPAVSIPTPNVLRFEVPLGPGREPANTLALSPDGRHLVYGVVENNVRQLYLRSFDQVESVPISGTENSARWLFFSPDSSQLGFATQEGDGWTLKRVPLAGGNPITILAGDGQFYGGAWRSDDTIIFGAALPDGDSVLRRVSASGGTPEPLTVADGDRTDLAHIVPVATPDPDTIFFTIFPMTGPDSEARIAALSLSTGAVTVLLEDATLGTYLPGGHLFYSQGNQRFLTVPFDLETLSITGLPTLIPFFDDISGNVAIGADGTMAYVPQLDTARALPSMIWVNRDGSETALGLEPDYFQVPRISPDGNRVAVERGLGDERDVWVRDLDRGTFSPVTREPGIDRFPLWTPDGDDIVFASGRGGGAINLYRRSADGTGPVTRLATSDNPQFPYAWSRDTQDLVFVEQDDALGTNLSIRLLPMAEDALPRALVEGPFQSSNPSISPDGQWLAYRSNESGQDEIYVERFPELGERVQVSTEGGQAPLWSSDGQELFYRDGDAMMTVPIALGPPLSVGLPEQLFEGPYLNDLSRNYDVTRDGTRFLMITNPGSAPEVSVQVVLNWLEELDTGAPVP
jgi:serine/threonine-protein kinase